MTGAAVVDATPAPHTAAFTPETPEKRRAVPWRGAVITICLAVLPFATFLATNREEGVRVEQVLPYAGMVVYVGVAVVGFTWAIRGALSADRIAIALGGGWFVTVNYPGISGALEGLGLRVRYQLLGWGLVFLAAVVASWWASRRSGVRLWFLLFAVLITAIPLLQVTQHRLAVSEARPASAEAVVAGLERTPDIYYVLTDGYGRADILEEMFGFDNSAFLGSLEDRGFVVANEAYANYARTFLSVPAVLQMDYVAEPGPQALTVAEDDRMDRSVFHAAIQGDSALAETLRDAGYRYVQAPSGTWNPSDCSGVEDLCVEPISESGAGVVLGEVEWSLLQMTPAADLLSGLGDTFDDVAADPVHTVREIERQSWDEPVFAFIHMMHPHQPFPFDEQCRPRATGGRDIVSLPEGSEPAYVAGIQCTNRRLEAMLDVVPRDAVVVIQADHGSNYRGHDWYPEEAWGDAHLEERFAVLSAVRLPEDCRGMVDDRLAGVNTFRVVLACLSGEEPHLLPYRHMYNATGQDPELHEVELPTAGR